MKNIVVVSIMACMFAFVGQLFGSEVQDDITEFKNLFFIRDKYPLSLFCYFPKSTDQQATALMYNALIPSNQSYTAIFAQESFDEVKRMMDTLYTKYITQDSSLHKQYNLCKQLMSHIQGACFTSYAVFKTVHDDGNKKFGFTGKKGFTKHLETELNKIYNAVQSVASLVKDLQGSAWSRFTNKFGKKSDGELALQTIKDALLKRAKELVHSYNNDIKKITTKEIKFKPVKI